MPLALKNAYRRFKQAPLFLRIASYLLLAYAIYAIILGLIIPAVAQSQAPKQLSVLLGRDVRIQKVSINPFLLRFRIQGFDILEADTPMQDAKTQKQKNNPSFVSFDSLDLQIGFWKSIIHLAPTVEHLYLIKPQVTVARLNSNSEFNFTDIIDTLAKNATPDPDEKIAAPNKTQTLPAFYARDIKLTQGRFDFIDTPTGAHLQYQGLNLHLPQLDSQAVTLVKPDQPSNSKSPLSLNKKANHFALEIIGVDKGSLSLKGQFQFQPFALQGDLVLDKITLARFWPFAEKELKAKLTDGQFDLSTQFALKDTNDAFNFTTDKGQFTLRNLEFSDNNVPKIKLPTLKVNNVALNSQNKHIDIQSLALDGLWLDAALTKNGLDLQKLFSPIAQQKNQTSSASSQTTTNQPTTNQAAVKQKVAKRTVAKDTTSKAVTNASSNKSDDSKNTPWLLHLHQFDMKNTDININEKMVSNGVHWRIYPLSITTKDVFSDLSKPIDYNVNLSVNSWLKKAPDNTRGSFNSQGSVDLTKVDRQGVVVKGKVALSQLDLTQLQTYLNPYLNVQLLRGKLSTQGNFNADTKGAASYSGSAQIANLLIRDRLEYQPLIKWSNMTINNLKFDQKTQRLNIDTINFTAPYSKVLIDKQRHTNIGSIVKPQPASTNTSNKKSAPSKPLKVYIKQIKFTQGSALFADYSLPTSFQSGIESISGNIRNLSSTPGTKASVDIKGKINKYAPVTLKGHVNPLIKQPYLDLDLIFKSVELTSVNPYSGTYAGYYIDKGQLSLDLKYKLEKNQLLGDNHLVVDQLKLGKKSDSDLATSLPLTLAIALLQDRHGVIDLGLQVSGDVNSPDFSVGSIVLQALTNIITKAVTSPFSLLAGLAGSDEELNHIPFDAGKSQLNEEAISRLTTLGKALQDRPMLKLSVVGAVSAADDSHALAEEKLQQKLLQESGLDELPKNSSASSIAQNEDLADSLEDLYSDLPNKNVGDEEDKVKLQIQQSTGKEKVNSTQLNTALHISLYNQLVNEENISPDELGSLAVERSRTIKAYLVDEQKIDPARVFILDSKSQLKTDSQGADLTIDAQ
ncbi:DUF748 domain-containing protein [Vibrio sp. S17_S38]|uniref:DUF748 domain-containing protein n=1 Tax=Vibrio sp. S17_S38 TaxID=2720229 RepID=UPI00168100E8|nr:DUF748 domain-containing protein [Vibrio sp. S17_S38]MBD1572165.1 DUF748 domain-containing protein [Vibrio sp. S17_S38]